MLPVALTILLKSSVAQTIPADFIEQMAEKLSETTTRDFDFSDLADEFDQLRDHPINLNNSTFEELHQLSFLNDVQLNNLFLYIQSYGALYSPQELFAIDGFDSATVRKILPFIVIGSTPQKHPVKIKELLKYGRSELVTRYKKVLQKQKGYLMNDSALKANPNSGYVGSQQAYFFRYKYSFYDRLSFGFSGEKDPGEEFFKGSQPLGMDFYSGYLELMHTGILKTAIIGNFRAGFGQGLVMGSGISAASIPGVTSLRRTSGGIKPSLSANEETYLRGAATTIQSRHVELSAFYSDHKIDGNPTMNDTTTGEILEVSSMNGTGYHRLPKEIQNKNIIRERIWGGNLNFRNNYFSIGLTGFHSHWSASLEPRSYPYNSFSFKGTENLNLGSDFQVGLRTIYLFGEFGRSMNGGFAWLLGGQFSPDPRMFFTLLFRNYQRNYQDLLGNAYGQNSLNANETGFTVTFTARPFSCFTVSGYADLFRFPWLKYQVDSPTQGSEYQVQGDYSASRNVVMHLRMRMKTRQVNSSGSQEPVTRMTASRSVGLRYQLDWNVSNSVMLKNRVDFLENQTCSADKQQGYLVSQEFSLKLPAKPFSIAAMYDLFDTDSYYERIYVYESDVQYGYSVPAFYGKGVRFSLLADWTPFRWLTFWVKFAQTFYTDRNVIGTGPEEIDGNRKSDLTIQVRFRF